MHWFCLLQLAI